MNKMVKATLVSAAVVAGCFFSACSESTPTNGDVAELPQSDSESLVVMSKADLDKISTYEDSLCDEDDASCEEEDVYPMFSIVAKRIMDPHERDKSTYEICYYKVESPDAETVEVCPANLDGSDLSVKFYLVAGLTFADSGYVLEYGKVYFGGIDLTDGIVVRKNAVQLPPGRFTLWISIDDNLKKIASFRMSATVDVVSENAVAHFFDDDGKEIVERRADYDFVGEGLLADELTLSNLVPVYVSALSSTADGKLLMNPYNAVDVEYTLHVEEPVHLYKRVGGEYSEIYQSSVLRIGSSGVDTIYVAAFSKDVDGETLDAHLSVVGGNRTANIVFKKP
ncbi:MAG: hypothetical protein MJZ25_04315 [Fibrobacter sp.]|nr:hypothetical protein [Fibrobacter sp.]